MTPTDLIAAIKRDLEAAQLLLDGVVSKVAVLSGMTDVKQAKSARQTEAVTYERMWCAARNRILVRDYPLGIPSEIIADRVNAISGVPVPMRRIAVRAGRLGLKRPDGYKRKCFAGPKAETRPSHPTVAPLIANTPQSPAEEKPAAPQPKTRMETLMRVTRMIEAKKIATKQPFSMLGGTIRRDAPLPVPRA